MMVNKKQKQGKYMIQKNLGLIITFGLLIGTTGIAKGDCSWGELEASTFARIQQDNDNISVTNFRAGGESETDGASRTFYTIIYSFDLPKLGERHSIMPEIGYETYDQNCQSTSYATMPAALLPVSRTK
jgi:hypothetical protein